MMEARKSGLIKYVEFDADSYALDKYEDEICKNHYKIRRNLFQMLLLFDELIIEFSDPRYDYHKIKEMGNFTIYPFDDFWYYNPLGEEENSLYAKYLKPAILPIIVRKIKHDIVHRGRISYKRIASELYDVVLGISKNLSSKVDEILHLNKKLWDLSHSNRIRKFEEIKAPQFMTKTWFYTYLMELIRSEYERLCWQLKISAEQDAYIINSEYKLSHIGCDIYEKNISTYMESYRILKCECAKLIGTLPHIESIEEAISLKEKRGHDIKNLREVLDNLENVLKNDGKESAIIKAANDVKKASSALSKRNRINKVGEWTTLFSIPVAVMEMLLGGGVLGGILTAVGTGVYIIDKKVERDNNWCEIVR